RGRREFAGPGRSPSSNHAGSLCGPAKRIARDRPAAAPPRQIAGRGKRRNEEIAATLAQQSGTECFTMFQTPMDTHPLPSSGEPSTLQSTLDSAPLASPTPPMLRGARESPFREVFLGPDGMFAGTRWLIYLAMGGIIFLLEGALLHFVHPHASGAVWWGMVPEAGMMLAA